MKRKRLFAPAAARTFGPIRILVRSLAPEFRPGLPCKGHIDVSACRGRSLALTTDAAAALLGSSKASIGRLVELGVLDAYQSSSPSRHRYVLIDPDMDLPALFRRWARSMAMPTTHADFARYKEVRALCHVWAGADHPETVLEGVFLKLTEIGNCNRQEVNGLIPICPSNFHKISASLGRRRKRFASRRNAISDEMPVTLELFRESLPPAFLQLPKSCLAGPRSHEREPPSRRVRHRLWRLERLYEAGSLYALQMAGRVARPDLVLEHVLVIERVEAIMTAFAPTGRWTAAVYRDAFRAYAVDCTIRPDDVPAVRDLTVRYWRMIVSRLHRYAARVDPLGRLGLKRFLPPKFAIAADVLAGMRALYGDLRPEGRERRKRESNAAFAELDAIMQAARNRRDAWRTIGAALRIEEDAFADGETHRDFQVRLPTLDRRGRLTGGMQVEHFRLWRLGAAWGSMAGAAIRKSPLGHALYQNARREHAGFVVEHLRTTGDAGSDPRTDWMITLSKQGTTVCPAELPLAMREARHEAIRSGGLPGYGGHGAGLLAFEVERAALARSGHHIGRHFVPVAEIEHAIRLGFAALDIVEQSMRRRQEVQQLVRLDWTRTDLLPGQVHLEQKVIPKVPRGKSVEQVEKVAVVAREESVNELLDLCDLQMRRCGYAAFPTMQPTRFLQWKCGPGEYLFSHAGRALLPSEVSLFLRYLLAGWPPFTLHDFRHAGAEEAEFDDEPEDAIQDGLGHADRGSTAGYRKLSPEAQRVKDARSEERRMTRLDDWVEPPWRRKREEGTIE